MIIMTGVAGSGKSVQGKMLADKLGLPWLSTGEFLRMLISGEKRRRMLGGELLEDKEIISLVQKIFSLINTDEEFVLDGFPRTLTQADWLVNQHKHGQLNITCVIHLEASEDVVKERLLSRGRQDDHAKAITERFREYQDSIRPILDDFKNNDVPVFDVSGVGDIEVIHQNIISVIKS